ncbi:MAG: hypothetical protein FK734_20350 [Asgard group archaeon]|nr:hypothetical protein [Asgard group archaeon]
MGKNNLADAKTKFKEDTTIWSFDFDLTNAAKYAIFNGTTGHNDYFPYDEILFSFDLEYTDGGILKNYLMEISYTRTLNNITSSIQQLVHIVSGSLKSLTADFAYLSVIPALFVITIAVKFAANKRRNR